MRPANLTTKIFLDGGDPAETTQMMQKLGFLDGQTTNPTLISRNPHAKERVERGDKFTREEIYDFYRKVVKDIRTVLDQGQSISIEVYADHSTTAEQMIDQGHEMNDWIPGAHIKLPTTGEGLKAAQTLVGDGLSVNMTLVFSQRQAAAVYAATRGANRGQVYLSPFVGRLDDIGTNGMSLIDNIVHMYQMGDQHVEILTASVRNMEHFRQAIALGTDIITVPAKLLNEWADSGLEVPEHEAHHHDELPGLMYEELDLSQDWKSFDIRHELTDKGISRFADDWNALIASN